MVIDSKCPVPQKAAEKCLQKPGTRSDVGIGKGFTEKNRNRETPRKIRENRRKIGKTKKNERKLRKIEKYKEKWEEIVRNR